jgi:plastocyanin
MKVITILLSIMTIFLLIGCSTEEVIVEPTPVETPEPEPVPEVIDEPEEVIEDTPVVEPEVVEVAETTHQVEINKNGFDPKELDIKVGDTIVWKNVRSGRLNKVMILGSQLCVNIKSAILMPGEEFSYTFDKAQKCTFIDGITTTQTMKIVIE